MSIAALASFVCLSRQRRSVWANQRAGHSHYLLSARLQLGRRAVEDLVTSPTVASLREEIEEGRMERCTKLRGGGGRRATVDGGEDVQGSYLQLVSSAPTNVALVHFVQRMHPNTEWGGLGDHERVHRQLSVSSDSKLLDEDIREEARVILRPKKPPRPKSEVFLNKEHQRRTKRYSAFGAYRGRDR
uniref:Uncharacterized protein n=1 Tax=Timema tahoe TaxID=61484 RepID=A0A7R9NX80_9NEOP|nr:unnamed protein product [Timema tahoe]